MFFITQESAELLKQSDLYHYIIIMMCSCYIYEIAIFSVDRRPHFQTNLLILTDLDLRKMTMSCRQSTRSLNDVDEF